MSHVAFAKGLLWVPPSCTDVRSVSVNLGVTKGLVRTHATSPESPFFGVDNLLLCASRTVRQGKVCELSGLTLLTTIT